MISGGVRFAPSPTGRFHVGNLRTAWISEKWARALRIPWIVRFEDIDAPRVVAGAKEQQLADLAALGLWPDAIVVQSQARSTHLRLFTAAVRGGFVYPCLCTRKEIASRLSSAPVPDEGFAEASAPNSPAAPALEYDGRCRSRPATDFQDRTEPVGWRFRSAEDDGSRDFIVARARVAVPGNGVVLPVDREAAPAYNWACAVDDALGGYDLLVRAWDLADVVAPQQAVGRLVLAAEARATSLPDVYHAALVTQDGGQRLEKRTGGVTLAELAARGVGPERLLKIFEESYRADFERDLAAYRAAEKGRGASTGEARRAIALKELGL